MFASCKYTCSRSEFRNQVHVALQHFKEMQDLGLVDVVSYNTLLKAYLKQGQIVKARKLLGEMAENNIQANQVTYNEMLNALVTVKDRKEMWALVREMNAMGMQLEDLAEAFAGLAHLHCTNHQVQKLQ